MYDEIYLADRHKDRSSLQKVETLYYISWVFGEERFMLARGLNMWC